MIPGTNLDMIETNLEKAPESVLSYLRAKFSEFLADDEFIESVQAHLPIGSRDLGREARILDYLKTFAAPAGESG